MADIIYMKDRIKIINPVVPAISKKVKIDKLGIKVEELSKLGVEIVWDPDDLEMRDGTHVMMMHKKSLKIHMRPTDWGSTRLACGRPIWGDGHKYAFFEAEDTYSFLTCEKCINIYLFGRIFP